MEDRLRAGAPAGDPYCPACGAEVGEDDRVCPSCGAPLPDEEEPSTSDRPE